MEKNSFNPEEEFVYANNQEIIRSVINANLFIERNIATSIIINASSGDSEIVVGKIAPEDIYGQTQEDLSYDQARETAEHGNNININNAQTQLSALLRQCLMKRDLDEHDRLVSEGSGDELAFYIVKELPQTLDFDYCRVDRANLKHDDNNSVEVVKTSIVNLESYGSAERYIINIKEHGINKMLRILFIDEQPISVNTSVFTYENPLKERLEIILNPDELEFASHLIAGHYFDFEDLDNKIQTFRESLKGKYSELEAESLIGEIRNQAISQKELTLFAIKHNLRKPNLDEFDYFNSFLD